jgi:hypothetical protein
MGVKRNSKKSRVQYRQGRVGGIRSMLRRTARIVMGGAVDIGMRKMATSHAKHIIPAANELPSPACSM